VWKDTASRRFQYLGLIQQSNQRVVWTSTRKDFYLGLENKLLEEQLYEHWVEREWDR